MLVRVDLVFSYWILAWYLAYIAKLTPYNPKWGLVIGIIENIIFFIMLVLYGSPKSTIALFLLINFIIKGIPLYTIYNTNTAPIDIYALLTLFALYVLWVNANGTTVINHNTKIFQSVLHGKNETPSMWLISQIRKYL